MDEYGRHLKWSAHRCRAMTDDNEIALFFSACNYLFGLIKSASKASRFDCATQSNPKEKCPPLHQSTPSHVKNE